MRKHLSLAAVAAAALLMASTAQANIIWFSPLDPTAAAPATLGQYEMTAFGDDARPVFSLVSDVASPLGGVVGFSPELDHREVGSGWATWSHGYTGDVYYSSGLTATLDLPDGTGAFYFFAEPNPFSPLTITAVVGGTTFSQVVDGQGGARSSRSTPMTTPRSIRSPSVPARTSPWASLASPPCRSPRRCC